MGEYDFTVKGFVFEVSYTRMFGDPGIAVFMPADELDRNYAPAFAIAPKVYAAARLYISVSLIAENWGGAQFVARYAEYEQRERFLENISAFFDAKYDKLMPDIGEEMKNLRALYQRPEFYPERPKVEKVRTPSKGYVYLISDGNGCYKIGKTKQPSERLKTLRIGSPRLEYVALIPTNDMTALETSLHEIYRGARAVGEWFDLTPDDVMQIKALEVQA